MFHQPQNINSLIDMRHNTTCMVFECELAVKLDVKDVNFGTSEDINHRQDQVTSESVQVLDLLTTKALVTVLLGFSIMNQ